MSQPIQCPQCGQQYALGADTAGKWVQCKKCGKQFQVPGGSASVPPLVPPSAKPHPVQPIRVAPGQARPATPVQPVPAIPVQAVPVVPVQPVPAVPVQPIPVAMVQPVPVAAVQGQPVAPLATPAAPVNPALGPTQVVVVAPRRRYRRHPFLEVISHPLIILAIIAVVLGVVIGLGVYFSKDIAKLFASKPLPGDEGIRGYIALLNDLADILETIKDPQSAQTAASRMMAIQTRERELGPKLLEFNQATPEQKEHLRKKYETRMKEVQARLEKEMNRVLALAGRAPIRFGSSMAGSTRHYSWDGPLASIFGDEQPQQSQPQPGAGPSSQPTESKVVRVEVLGVPAGQREFVVDRLREASDNASISPDSGGGDVVAANITPISDLDAFATRIDLGTSKVDSAKRGISIQANLAKFPKPMPPEAKNPAHADFYKANLAELTCPDGARRREAAERLEDADPKELRNEIAQALLPLLRENNPQTRRAAAEAWAVWRTDVTAADAGRYLLSLVHDQDAQVRAAAFKAMAQVKDPQIAESVAKMLTDRSLSEAAAECLAGMGPAGERATLPYLVHKDDGVRSEAKQVMLKIATKESVPALVELLQQNKANSRQVLELLGVMAKLKDERCAAAVAELLGDFFTRSAAKEFFFQMGPAAEKAMIDALDNPNKEVVKGAMEVLEKIGTKACVPAVVQAMKNQEHFDRREAIKLLVRLKDERSVPAIAELLKDFFARRDAVEALKKFGPAAEDTVIKYLSNPDRAVGMECLDVLAEIGTEKSLKALKPYTKVRDAGVRQKVAETMQAITDRTGATMPGKEKEKPKEEEK